MEKYRKFLPAFVIVNLVIFLDNFSTYLCFYYIPGAHEANPLTSALISNFGISFGLIIHQIASALLFSFAIFASVDAAVRYKLIRLAACVFIFAAIIVLTHFFAAAHNFIMLMNFLTF